jgi:hypothetical protein
LNTDAWSTSSTRDFPGRGHDSTLVPDNDLARPLGFNGQKNKPNPRSWIIDAGIGASGCLLGREPSPPLLVSSHSFSAFLCSFLLLLLTRILHNAIRPGRRGNCLSDRSSRRCTAVSVTVTMALHACGRARLNCAGGLWDLDLLQVKAIHGFGWLARPRRSVSKRNWL